MFISIQKAKQIIRIPDSGIRFIQTVSLGVSVDIAKAATDVALKIIALVNPKMPRSHGDGQIHISKIAAAVFHEHDLYELKQSHLSETELAIGKNIAEIIEDGATLQMGIGGIPNAVLQCLTYR